MALCPYCIHWAREAANFLPEHHARCPLNPALAPREEGPCHCGATVLTTGGDPCIFCGGFTREQLDLYRALNGEGKVDDEGIPY
jgi:hypothetical protein